MDCFKWLACCGFGCGLISSIGDIFRGIRTVKEDVIENIENHFHPKTIYYIHKEGNIYLDLRENEDVELIFFETKPLDKSSSL